MIRTTIELTEGQRRALVELAMKRGQRGFSLLVQEAVDRYLADVKRFDRARREALRLRGSLAGRAAARLRANAVRARKTWDR